MANPTNQRWPVHHSVPLIPREILVGNPTRLSPTLSPDGKHLAYLAPHDGVLEVWVATVGESDDRPMTRDPDRGIRTYRWSPGRDQSHSPSPTHRCSSSIA